MHELKDANLVFRALIILGLVAFGFYIAEDRGLVSLALDSDKSYISYLILGLYGLASAHWLWLAQRLGEERRRFAILEAASTDPEILDPEGGLLGAFLSNLRVKTDSDTSALLEAFGDELANRHALGHFTSDVLLKLGLLGTVVGFILMLLPVGEITEFDPSLMQQLLSAMSGGMAVALYTTLAGLVTSTLLALQYHLLDTSAAQLVTRLHVLVDVRLKPGAA
ncbi:MAG: MotA/TolQ/ExbB proton channel family protein [Gammaproteobacteria bacterium]|nr:MotA/TolQ/ExbB proton channel family protein [Gammaproteobacteria bacterium]